MIVVIINIPSKYLRNVCKNKKHSQSLSLNHKDSSLNPLPCTYMYFSDQPVLFFLFNFHLPAETLQLTHRFRNIDWGLTDLWGIKGNWWTALRVEESGVLNSDKGQDATATISETLEV